ncbi:M13 family metallopeptidase [Candidatus Parcubacteria bacterium]|nr:M13 family metallopeptidase [Candidatus Parcubacteria bacterium]
MVKKIWEFDVRDMDTSVRPQDDLFHYTNGGWQKRNPIPKNESRWGTFTILRYETDKKVRNIIEELLTLKRAALGSPEQMIRDLFRSGIDMKSRNRLALAPLAPWFEKITAIKSTRNLQDVIACFHRMGIGVLFNAEVDQDAKNTKRYLLYFVQDGLGMPDRDYYLDKDTESIRVRNAYREHVLSLFRLAGYKPQEAKKARDTVMHIETSLARVSMNKVDRREIQKIYHKFTIAKLQKLSPVIEWKRYLARTEGAKVRECVVMQPDFFKALGNIITKTSLDDWKTYVKFHLINEFADALSSRFVQQSFNFYGKALLGTPSMKPLWRRVLGVVNHGLGELVGRIYVKKHFPPEAKRAMKIMVDDLFEAYRTRINNLDWMGPATKKKALRKLSTMARKIGYPDTWKSFKGLVIRPDDYAGNLERIAVFLHKRAMRKLSGPIDRNEWHMCPHTVNAYFSPTMNEIVFPAAILQPPFFTLGGDQAINYGGIGAVIGHEITHGFDDEGSKFDHEGNFKSWWTPKDRKRFEAKSKVLVQQFNTYKIAGLAVNGQLTLGENIADLGGASISYDAYQRERARSGSKVINGFTPEQRFFLGFALFERENSRPECMRTQVLTDPHAPHVFRINGPASNVQSYYEAFGVKRGDKLYREPKKRARIW